MKSTPIYSAFRGLLEEKGFEKNPQHQQSKREEGFYRDIDGLNQRIYLVLTKGWYNFIHYSDIIGLHGFEDANVQVSAGGSGSTHHFYRGSTQWMTKLSKEEAYVDDFLKRINNEAMDCIERYNSANKLACMYPADYLQLDVNPTYYADVLGIKYRATADWSFMRMISSNLYLGNLDLAQQQAKGLMLWAENVNYNTQHIEGLANFVCDLRDMPSEMPILEWRNKP